MHERSLAIAEERNAWRGREEPAWWPWLTTVARYERVLALLEQGRPASVIAREVGLSRVRVYQIREARDDYRAAVDRYRRALCAEIARLVQRYLRRRRCATIAARFHAGRLTRCAATVEMRSVPAALDDIARWLGCTRERIRCMLREHEGGSCSCRHHGRRLRSRPDH